MIPPRVIVEAGLALHCEAMYHLCGSIQPIEGVVTGRRRHRILLSNHEANIVMSDYRHGYVRFQNHEYKVTWHPISKEVYVYWGTDKYAGKAYEMQEALDIALSWLSSHAR